MPAKGKANQRIADASDKGKKPTASQTKKLPHPRRHAPHLINPALKQP
ncbi:hypothetical protein SAMN05192539_102996 [Paraburkholderia diazotrophica]|uniref:Uncharacterized protein n=1 Tax=Paraburkholderia diazotrophica TaxID=667676 RepID=A0A1H7DFL4_9BURK|nr:hypothetical protein SAMN05192539_102996 [Paraburkholderia diazotrophica]